MSRIDYIKVKPAVFQAMMGVENAARKGTIDHVLAELVRMRVSQINGCAFCLDMHSEILIEHGENPQRLYLLPAWRDSSLYSPRERAALAWAEAMTNLPGGAPQDAVYEALTPHFSEEEIVDLSLIIAVINSWNRFGVGFEMPHPVR